MLRKLILLLLIPLSYADGTKALNLFMQSKNAAISADFTQTVFGKRKNQVTTGIMKIQRPDKFLWQYSNDGQLIISDGKQIYIYDKLLKQVTIKKLTKTLGKSPALLLAGGVDIKQVYTITPKPDVAGLEWVLLTPKNNDSNSFKAVALGFSKTANQLDIMQFEDQFGNKSQIKFTNFKSQVKFAPNEFQFIIAKGIDIINADNN
jgi:chaperone LolA